MIYAVDFDGTLCRNAWPGIGEPNEALIRWLLREKAEGATLILWTMREGKGLEEAIAWCAERGLTFDAVNDNVQALKDAYGNNPRKVFADKYIDDHNAEIPQQPVYKWGGVSCGVIQASTCANKNKKGICDRCRKGSKYRERVTRFDAMKQIMTVKDMACFLEEIAPSDKEPDLKGKKWLDYLTEEIT